ASGGCRLPGRGGMPSCFRLADNAEGAHPRARIGQYTVQTLKAVEPCGVRGDRFGRRALRLPSQGSQGTDVRENVAGVAEAVVAGHPARLVGTVLTHDD